MGQARLKQKSKLSGLLQSSSLNLSRFKFDDERVIKEDMKRALEEQYSGEEEVEEGTRRKGTQEGKSRGAFIHHNLVFIFYLLRIYTPELRLLEMRILQNRLEGKYILILLIMTKFIVFVFRSKCLLTFSSKGKDITELIASGREKLAAILGSAGGAAVSMSVAVGGGGAAVAPAAAEPKKEEKVEEKEESDNDMGFSLFDQVEEKKLVLIQKHLHMSIKALQYLLKLFSHPLLVLGERQPDSLLSVLSELMPDSANIVSDLHELHHAPKLVALQEILEECGIGLDASSAEGTVEVGQHRVLIFAQHKSFLDIIERDLFHNHMKSITYLQLDGSVEPERRFEIVKAFNFDPTIDVLLLTTLVGGLGLNLTSADTLVFMEHDWNPMIDHQAMDRAHRLGQRKVVNVHRLIMSGTLEEKVMSLQKFKVSVANAVINAENASLNTGATTQSKSSNGSLYEDPKMGNGVKGLKTILSGLEELWDQSQYTEEYNLSQFLAKLNG